MRVPEALAEIRKVVARPAPRIMNYAEAAAKPRQRPPPQTRPLTRLGTGHTLIVASKFENHTAEHVITKLRGVVDARRWVWPWTDEEGQGTKVVLSCSSVEDAKKIEERLKIRGADKGRQARNAAPHRHYSGRA
ncbi:hypothetical protein EVAR_90711_1 [Eumeta japonica]|uniref:Uncharacterized protein n=1 Tax=Eumeta variegata TaxID=151549 RepID=A0A4C1SCU3_EUMVA|nr:hypothetical protein EVAR_90711_1 [Eumeta japonica]